MERIRLAAREESVEGEEEKTIRIERLAHKDMEKHMLIHRPYMPACAEARKTFKYSGLRQNWALKSTGPSQFQLPEVSNLRLPYRFRGYIFVFQGVSTSPRSDTRSSWSAKGVMNYTLNQQICRHILEGLRCGVSTVS